ncbi:hypothetical protein LCGC14_2819610 [marine sediment metagenome]|uniref:Uncharacterized protein n=1 Tax=marine sediment metagenome TaxID=412755 RepID=A0A0F9B8L5_9ZZZZ
MEQLGSQRLKPVEQPLANSIILDPVFESKAESAFRENLWKKGDERFGEGFLKHCVHQKSFITTKGTIEHIIGGMAASDWVNDITSQQPSPQALTIGQQVLCVPEFVFVLDGVAFAVLFELDQPVAKGAASMKRAMYRALLYLGFATVPFTFDDVLDNPESAVDQTLDLLDRSREMN